MSYIPENLSSSDRARMHHALERKYNLTEREAGFFINQQLVQIKDGEYFVDFHYYFGNWADDQADKWSEYKNPETGDHDKWHYYDRFWMRDAEDIPGVSKRLVQLFSHLKWYMEIYFNKTEEPIKLKTLIERYLPFKDYRYEIIKAIIEMNNAFSFAKIKRIDYDNFIIDKSLLDMATEVSSNSLCNCWFYKSFNAHWVNFLTCYCGAFNDEISQYLKDKSEDNGRKDSKRRKEVRLIFKDSTSGTLEWKEEWRKLTEAWDRLFVIN